MDRFALLLLFAAGLAGCGQLDSMRIEPPLRPDQWCTNRPCVAIGGVVLDQPFGTALVYLLAALFVGVGWRLWQDRREDRARLWWARSLVLGGVAAGLAGTSYQALGYELKCAGRGLCIWTDWFEIAYMVLQNVSVDCMVVAVAYSSTRQPWRRGLCWYAGVNAATHLLVTAYGVWAGIPFLLSFELLLLFSTPAFVFALVLNGGRFYRQRQALDRALLGGWCWLFLTNVAYYTYLLAGVTDLFWRAGHGIYFSENDVLHIGMIGYVLYLHFVVAPHIQDIPVEP